MEREPPPITTRPRLPPLEIKLTIIDRLGIRLTTGIDRRKSGTKWDKDEDQLDENPNNWEKPTIGFQQMGLSRLQNKVGRVEHQKWWGKVLKGLS